MADTKFDNEFINKIVDEILNDRRTSTAIDLMKEPFTPTPVSPPMHNKFERLPLKDDYWQFEPEPLRFEPEPLSFKSEIIRPTHGYSRLVEPLFTFTEECQKIIDECNENTKKEKLVHKYDNAMKVVK